MTIIPIAWSVNDLRSAGVRGQRVKGFEPGPVWLGSGEQETPSLKRRWAVSPVDMKTGVSPREGLKGKRPYRGAVQELSLLVYGSRTLPLAGTEPDAG